MGIPKAEQTLRLTDGGPLTIDAMVQGAETLRRMGAPADAPLSLRQDGRDGRDGWAMIVKWTPASAVADAPPYLKDPEPAVNFHLSPEVVADLKAADAERAQRIQRRVRDNLPRL